MDTSSADVALSVIIPVFNQVDYLETLLRSLRAVEPDGPAFEIIVVDDGSDVDLKPSCDAFGAGLIRVEPNQGPANARNRGADEARGDTLMFFDVDVQCPPNLLKRAIEILDGDPEIDAVSFMNEPYSPRDNAVKNYGGTIEYFWFLQLFEGDEPYTRNWCFTTRNGAVRTKVFRELQGFDAQYRTNAHEDYDIGKRLAAHSKIVLAREPLVYHSYPDKLYSVVRNCWVRVGLFVPYYIVHRPKLDKVQVSYGEAALRIAGSSIVFWLILAILPIPGTRIWAAMALLATGAYLLSIRAFLRQAYVSSHSVRFVVLAAGIHFVTSLTVTFGGLWGLAKFLLNPKRTKLLSPIK